VSDSFLTQYSIQYMTDENRPLVTFALFAYNQEKYIAEAVEGALAQTYSPLEIIISDDCSTDRTFEIIRECVSKYDGPHRVVLNQNERNRGLISHINHVLSLVRSDWVIIGAGDDISHRERVSVNMQCLEMVSYRPRAMFSRFQEFINKREVIPLLCKSFEGNPELRKLSRVGHNRVIEGMGYIYPGASWAYHRDCWSVFGEIPRSLNAEDFIMPYRASLLGDILVISDQLVARRLSPSSLGRINTSLDFFETAKSRGALVSAIVNDTINAYKCGLVSGVCIDRRLSRLYVIESRLLRRIAEFPKIETMGMFACLRSLLGISISGDLIGALQFLRIFVGKLRAGLTGDSRRSANKKEAIQRWRWS